MATRPARHSGAPARAPMGTRNVPRAVRERQMVAEARRLFSERGYDDVSMAEIARGVGVSKPLVYAYFESKEGLFLACVDDATRELMAALEAATPPTLPPDVRLWRGLLASFSFAEDAPEAWSLLHPAGAAAEARLAKGAARANQAMTELIARLLRDAAVSGGIDAEVARQATEPLAHALVAAVEAVAAWARKHPDESRERQALRMMNFAWTGLDNLLRGELWLPPPEGAEAWSRGGAVRPLDAAARAERLAAELADDRARTLEEVFARMVDRFDPARAAGVDAVVEWRVGGRPGGGDDRVQLRIDATGARVLHGARARPDVVLGADEDAFVQLVSGAARGSTLFTAGRLRVEGDVVLAARVPAFFARAGR